MSKGAINFSNNVEYYTPKEIVDMFGKFDYDPATTDSQAKYLGISTYDTKETNGLLKDWRPFKRIWINPPFNLKGEFLSKAVETYCETHNDIYYLCPLAYFTTKSFHESLRGLGIKLFIPKGRIKFLTEDDLCNKSPAFGSAVIKIQDSYDLELIDELPLTNERKK